MLLYDIILVLVIILCFITDLRYQKIYNKVIFPALLSAVFFHTVLEGFNGLRFSLVGFIVGLFILFIPYLLKGFGAGDVKLLAVIGALKGSGFVLNTAVYMGLIGGLISFVLIIYHKQFENFVRSLKYLVVSIIYGTSYQLNFENSVKKIKFPYGICIGAGAIICLLFRGVWII
jgi:prepilin peptidase CpaA